MEPPLEELPDGFSGELPEQSLKELLVYFPEKLLVTWQLLKEFVEEFTKEVLEEFPLDLLEDIA